MSEPVVLESAEAPITETRLPAPSRLPAGSPLDLPAEIFAAGLGRRKVNRAVLMKWIREALVEGTDYGRIHTVSKDRCSAAKSGRPWDCQTTSHWSKPVLFKPGAEKICGMLGVTVHYPNLAAYEQAALAGVALQSLILRCEILDSQGRIVAEGVGARSVQKDYGDLNKSLKMAAKSAYIDATLRMAGLSEVFTQDLEDDASEPSSAPAPVSMRAPAAPVEAAAAVSQAVEAKVAALIRRAIQAQAWAAAETYVAATFEGADREYAVRQLQAARDAEQARQARAGQAAPVVS